MTIDWNEWKLQDEKWQDLAKYIMNYCELENINKDALLEMVQKIEPHMFKQVNIHNCYKEFLKYNASINFYLTTNIIMEYNITPDGVHRLTSNIMAPPNYDEIHVRNDIKPEELRDLMKSTKFKETMLYKMSELFINAMKRIYPEHFGKYKPSEMY